MGIMEMSARGPMLRASFLRHALAFWLIELFLVVLASYPIIDSHDEGIRREQLRDRGVRLRHTAFTVQMRLSERSANVHVLTQVPVIRKFLTTRDPPSRFQVERVFSGVIESYGVFDQARLIDLQGQEIIRMTNIDGHAVATPQRELQNKSDRYYVRDAQALNPGDLYISRVDLNVEHGQIERPFVPTVRLVTPLTDDHGQKAGLLVFNLLADALWAGAYPSRTNAAELQPMWIDSRGYWVKHPDPAQQWGEDLGKPELSMAARYPDAWSQVTQSRQGMARLASGFLLYDSVYPTDSNMTLGADAHAQWGHVVLADPSWKIAMEVPDSFLNGLTIQGRSDFWFLSALLLVVLCIPAAMFAWLLELRLSVRRKNQKITEQLHDFYENAPCGYHALDRDGIVVEINQTELDWIGYERAEVIGRPISEFLSAHSRSVVQQQFRLFLQAGSVQELELELIRKDGGHIPVSLAATAVKDAAGNFLYTRSTLFDLTERRAYEEKLAKLAYFDELTQLPNRRHFLARADEEVQRARRYGQAVAIVSLDVDHFKRVNDTYGHATGDAVLKALGSLLRDVCRTADIAGRMGGEEFAIILPNTDLNGALTHAERLRIRIETSPMAIEPPVSPWQFHITVSLGVAAWEIGDQPVSLEELLHRSDLALYRAKDYGRNRVAVDPAKLIGASATTH